MTAQPPPGWHPDPYGTVGLLRWWDGHQWTPVTQPAAEWDDAAYGPDSTAASWPVASSPYPRASTGQPGGLPADSAPADTPAPGSVPSPPPGAAPSPGTSPPPGASAPPGALPPAASAPGGDGAAGITPTPWGAPANVPGASAAAPGRPSWLWALAGGAGFLSVVGVVIFALFATGVLGTGRAGPPTPTRPPSSPKPDPSGKATIAGTITDSDAGLSYARLGGKWTEQQGLKNNSRFGFSSGQTAVVQQNYTPGQGPYVASAYAGKLPTSIGYEGTDDLESAARSFFTTVEPVSYPPHTTKPVESKKWPVGEEKAWIIRYQLAFPDAPAKGWNFNTENVAVVLVHRGDDEQPGLLYASIPDSHATPADLDQLVNSLKAL